MLVWKGYWSYRMSYWVLLDPRKTRHKLSGRIMWIIDHIYERNQTSLHVFRWIWYLDETAVPHEHWTYLYLRQTTARVTKRKMTITLITETVAMNPALSDLHSSSALPSEMVEWGLSHPLILSARFDHVIYGHDQGRSCSYIFPRLLSIHLWPIYQVKYSLHHSHTHHSDQ